MTDSPVFHSKTFNHSESAALRAAFDLAWDLLPAEMKEPADIADMRRRLTHALIVIANAGERSPKAMAARAVARCEAGLF